MEGGLVTGINYHVYQACTYKPVTAPMDHPMCFYKTNQNRKFFFFLVRGSFKSCMSVQNLETHSSTLGVNSHYSCGYICWERRWGSWSRTLSLDISAFIFLYVSFLNYVRSSDLINSFPVSPVGNASWSFFHLFLITFSCFLPAFLTTTKNSCSHTKPCERFSL